jgi:hypothetical protein
MGGQLKQQDAVKAVTQQTSQTAHTANPPPPLTMQQHNATIRSFSQILLQTLEVKAHSLLIEIPM